MGGLTHQQYLDEPYEVVEWMIRIDDIVERDQQERQSKRGW